jgi:hypothetical protein
MSVNWDSTKCEAVAKAREASTVDGVFNPDHESYVEMCQVREGLIYALLLTGFPPKSQWAITEKNWEEVYRRLFIVARAYDAIGFTIDQVKSFIGLAVNAGNKTEAEFRLMVMRHLAERPARELRDYGKIMGMEKRG